MHGFCDASERAYAGVVYIRGIDDLNNSHVALVIAKTKVAPIKRLTFARVELCGATILAKLINHTAHILATPDKDLFGWTNSVMILSWLRSNHNRFKTLVDNSVAQISKLIPPTCWRHVNSKDNPADCASSGKFPAKLTQHTCTLWWHGPTWLQAPESNWPFSIVLPDR